MIPWLFFLFPIISSQLLPLDILGSKDLKGHLPDQLIAELESSGIAKCLTSHRRSPINVDLGYVTITSFKPLKFENYESVENVTELEKNNVTATIHGYEHWQNRPTLSGGPLRGEYKLLEIHWEMMDLYNSRYNGIHYGHTIANAKYDFELHFVHTLNGLPLEKAVLLPEGIVIVATFINEQPIVAPSFGQFLNSSKRESDQNSQPIIPSAKGTSFEWLPPEHFIPEERENYFVYNGTFSHPPCESEATWILMANAIPLNMMEMKRYLHASYTRKNLIFPIARKLRESEEVFFNHPTKPMNLSPKSNETLPLKTSTNVHMEVYGGVAAAFFAILIVVVLVALAYRYYGRKQKRFDVNFHVGIDNINFIGQSLGETSLDTQ